MMCRNHPDKNAIAVCQKYNTGYCEICCECHDRNICCECSDPELYCKFRTQCIILEMCRQRKKKEQKINELEQQIDALNKLLVDRKQALPMHDPTPEQWLAVEETEDRLELIKKELKHLESE